MPEQDAQRPAPMTLDRRTFLGSVGGALALAGCTRRPVEHALPTAPTANDAAPGEPLYYATSAQRGADVMGLIVETTDGRPIKIEGNAKHPLSKGGVDAWTQAQTFALYDSQRARLPTERSGKAFALEIVRQRLDRLAARARARGGAGLALLLEYSLSPSYRDLLGQIRRTLPKAELFLADSCAPRNSALARQGLGLTGLTPHLRIATADVLLALDCDFLGSEGEAVSAARAFYSRRRGNPTRRSANRLYVVEPVPTLTGDAADNRLALPRSEVGAFLAQLIGQLFRWGVNPPAELQDWARRLAQQTPWRERRGRWVETVARRLRERRRRSLVLIGERQPVWVHELGWLLNQLLGNLGSTIHLYADQDWPVWQGPAAFVEAARRKQFSDLLLLGTNPLYTDGAEFAQALASIPFSMHLSAARQATSERCSWHVPRAHFLESWGDLRSSDGTIALQQPTLAPLFAALSDLEVLARLLGMPDPQPYNVVRQYFQRSLGKPGMPSEVFWRFAVHEGFVRRPAAAHQSRLPSFGGLKATTSGQIDSPRSGLELVFQLDWAVADGRYASNGWLQEAPDPITQLCWSSAALLSPTTAARYGVVDGQLIELSVGGAKVQLPALRIAGVAEGCVGLQRGYGQQHGLADGVGQDVGPLQGANWWRGGARLVPTASLVLLPRVDRLQDVARGGHASVVHRDTAEPARWHALTLSPMAAADPLPLPQASSHSEQWGMSIDTAACSGCGACVIACQAENNIAIVGPAHVVRYGTMHWLHIERRALSERSPHAGQSGYLRRPVACQHCEHAPCESACPVSATQHSPDGLNQMVYSACVGAGGCARDCPYGVRRFNHLDHAQRVRGRSDALALNPRVSVRSDGVMEKCSYCVQRIVHARAQAKQQGRQLIPDGWAEPACARTCPTQAIVFGNVADRASRVRRQKRSAGAYRLLAAANTSPRTSYLLAFRNPDPRLS